MSNITRRIERYIKESNPVSVVGFDQEKVSKTLGTMTRKKTKLKQQGSVEEVFSIFSPYHFSSKEIDSLGYHSRGKQLELVTIEPTEQGSIITLRKKALRRPNN